MKETLKKENYMCKIDLKDAYFASCNMIMQQCQDLLGKLPVFIKELSKLTDCLVKAAVGVLTSPFQNWAMQRQQGVANRGSWRSLECKSHINAFELNALKFGISTFTHMHSTV